MKKRADTLTAVRRTREKEPNEKKESQPVNKII